MTRTITTVVIEHDQDVHTRQPELEALIGRAIHDVLHERSPEVRFAETAGSA